jgi:hypothetical protein
METLRQPKRTLTNRRRGFTSPEIINQDAKSVTKERKKQTDKDDESSPETKHDDLPERKKSNLDDSNDDDSDEVYIGDDPDCIAPCYPAGVKVLHPLTLQYVTHPKQPFCPVKPWKDKLHQGIIRNIKTCRRVSSKQTEKSTENDFIFPAIRFSPRKFLAVNYMIFNYDDLNKWWFEQDVDVKLPWRTVQRIFDLTLRSYGFKKWSDEPLDDDTVEVLRMMILRYWANGWAEIKSVAEIVEFFSSKAMRQIINGYVRANSEAWSDIPSHTNRLKEICDQLLKA